MYEWQEQIQIIINEIDRCIQDRNDEALTLHSLSCKLGYSEFYTTRKFKEISGMQFRDYLRCRKLAFALKEVRDSERGILEIAFDYGFSSHEAFTRAFKAAYGVTPSEYRKKPVPVVLRTKINPFDRYFLGIGEIGMTKSTDDVKIYFVTIPAHKFLHIRNYESIGYWDFWQKQSLIPGQDCHTICGLLDSIKGKLDDDGGSESNSGSGQIMAYINEPKGRICSWGIPLAECYGVRLPSDYNGEVPPQMISSSVDSGDNSSLESSESLEMSGGVTSSHWAYRTIVAPSVSVKLRKLPPFSMALPLPSAFVFQPLKSYPVLANPSEGGLFADSV